MKKKYESTKVCRDRYNKINSTIQINRNLVEIIKGLKKLEEFYCLQLLRK